MAAGDVVSQLNVGSATVSSFQPAAGVEVMFLFASASNTSWIGLYDGTNLAINDKFTGLVKLAVNNTLYLAHYATSTNGGVSGIQIK